MTTIFDKFTGTFNAYDNKKIVVVDGDYKKNYYQGWYCLVDGVEHVIISNTNNEFFFNNSIAEIGSFEIVFIGREFLKINDSDFDDLIKIPSELIAKKYLLASNDLQMKLEGKFRMSVTVDFNPILNILNICNIQYSFSYHICQSIYMELSGSTGSAGYSEKRDIFFHSYNVNSKIALDTLIIDKNKNNIADTEERRSSINYRLKR